MSEKKKAFMIWAEPNGWWSALGRLYYGIDGEWHPNDNNAMRFDTHEQAELYSKQVSKPKRELILSLLSESISFMYPSISVCTDSPEHTYTGF